MGQMGRRGEDENEENTIKCNRKQITFKLMVKCHLIRQHPAGEKHETCFLMHYMHAHTPPFLRHLSSHILWSRICPKTFLSFHRMSTIHSLFDLIFPHLFSHLLLVSRIFAMPTSPTFLVAE